MYTQSSRVNMIMNRELSEAHEKAPCHQHWRGLWIIPLNGTADGDERYGEKGFVSAAKIGCEKQVVDVKPKRYAKKSSDHMIISAQKA